MEGYLGTVCLMLVIAVVHASTRDQFKLVLNDLATHPLAVCLDGTPGAFWFSPGVGEGVNKWLIHTQGGGWCSDEHDCVTRSQSFLGSSLNWTDADCSTVPGRTMNPCNYDAGVTGMFSSNRHINPLLAEWNRVYIGYCDGGSYAGGVLDPVSVGNATLYFRGRYIIDAIYDRLLSSEFGLDAATEIVLKGCSAGGLAVYLHVDQWVEKIREVNPIARIVAAPGAGFFLDIPSFNGPTLMTPVYRYVAHMQNVTASLNPACRAQHSDSDNWRCFLAAIVLPYIRTPLFVSNSLADSWQIYNIMALGCNPTTAGNCSSAQILYLNRFRQQMIEQLAPVLSSTVHGAFLQECARHIVETTTMSWAHVRVANVTQREVFHQWYVGSASKHDMMSSEAVQRGKIIPTVAVDGEWGTNPTCNKKHV